jgi:HrpA-like RNA helicase
MDDSNNANSEHDDRKSIDNSNFVKISEQRKTLPIYSFREDIVNTIKTHQILILVGETGSGKTTQIAQVISRSKFILYTNLQHLIFNAVSL